MFDIPKTIDNVYTAGQRTYDKVKTKYEESVRNDSPIGNPAHPDLSKFTKAINAEDLSRPNLFLVRFDNFLVRMGDDGRIQLSFGQDEEQDSGFSFADDYTIGKLKDAGAQYLMNTSLGQQIIGAYNPRIINMIPGGQLITGAFSNSFDVNKDMAMLVKSVSLPGSSLDSTTLWHDRRPMTAVTGRTNDTITMTFYLRTNHMERQVMDKWMSMVHNQENNTFGLYDSYAKKIDIFPLDRRGTPNSVVQCIGCFPTKISNVQYDVDNNNTIATFDVEFAISTYRTATFNGRGPLLDSVGSVAENVLTNPLMDIFK